MAVIFVCAHCNEPLIAERIHYDETDEDIFWWRMPCPCGSNLFVQIEVPVEMARTFE
jgi:hypothetical protein